MMEKSSIDGEILGWDDEGGEVILGEQLTDEQERPHANGYCWSLVMFSAVFPGRLY